MKRLFIVLLVMVMLLTLIGCQNEEKVELKKTDLGYNFSDFLDKDGEDLIKQLEADGAELTLMETDKDYNYEDYPFQWKTYQVTDTVYGLEYEVQLRISKSEDMETYQLSHFQKRITFPVWPEGDSADRIQNTVNTVIQQHEKLYGEFTALEGQDTEDILGGIPSNKSVQWHKDGFAFCGIDIVYDPQSEETKVIIYDESTVWDQIMTEYHESQK